MAAKKTAVKPEAKKPAPVRSKKAAPGAKPDNLPARVEQQGGGDSHGRGHQ